MCMKNTALGGVSQDKYSPWLFFVLYLSLDMPPHAVFSIHTRGSALSNIHTYVTGFWKPTIYTQVKQLESLTLNLCGSKPQGNQMYFCNYSGN